MAGPEVPITDLLSLLRNQRTRTERVRDISPRVCLLTRSNAVFIQSGFYRYIHISGNMKDILEQLKKSITGKNCKKSHSLVDSVT